MASKVNEALYSCCHIEVDTFINDVAINFDTKAQTNPIPRRKKAHTSGKNK